MTDVMHIQVDPALGFGLDNLPFGIIQHNDKVFVGIAIGEYVLNLAYLEATSLIKLAKKNLFNQTSLNTFAKQGSKVRQDVRQQVQQLLTSSTSALGQKHHRDKALIHRELTQLLYPFDTRGYTDFYSCENHARNVGSLFRDPDNALNRNWKQLPVAYHGRTSSLVTSGLSFPRPHGQILNQGSDTSIFGPSQKMDFEIEMGFFIGQDNTLFEPIPIDQARDHIFGFVLVNDWSARDIQAFEYVPLGPFLGKNFLTSVSPWVITPEALAPFKVTMALQEPQPLHYLQQSKRHSYDIDITASLITDGDVHLMSTSNFQHQYWSLDQQLAHHGINGCKMQTGDLLATGTLSGTQQHQLGCFLEMTRNGVSPITLANGQTRAFLEDGDTVRLSAQCKNDQACISFGEVSGTLTAPL